MAKHFHVPELPTFQALPFQKYIKISTPAQTVPNKPLPNFAVFIYSVKAKQMWKKIGSNHKNLS